MRRISCSACGDLRLESFLDLGHSPIADAYTFRSDEDSPRYPLEVAVCKACWLVQLLEVLPAEKLFGSGYSFYSSASPPLSRYHAQYAADILKRFPDQCTRGVVEIGCNDGDMLQHFRHLPHLGVDPADGPVGVAHGRDLNVVTLPFGLGTVPRLPIGNTGSFGFLGFGRAPGVIIANHVLAHVEDVADFLAGVATLADDETVIFIEVQYLPDLLINNSIDLIYHEHRNFFSLSSLANAAGRHGLTVIEVDLTDRQGGSLRVVLSKRSAAELDSDSVDDVQALAESENWLRSFSAYASMQARAERIRERLIVLVDERKEQGRKLAIYGAPAKLTTLLAFCGFDADDFAFCWDTTVAKQGRYVPCSPGRNIPIHQPWKLGDYADTFLLGAWNYAAPIMCDNPGIEWIIPFPAPVVLSSGCS